MRETLNISLPKGWHEMTDWQLKYTFRSLTEDETLTDDELTTYCFFRFGGLVPIRKTKDGIEVEQGGKRYRLTATQIAEALPTLDYLKSLPKYPVRLATAGGARAISAEMEEVTFEEYIVMDNYHAGYLHTKDASMIDEIGKTLYRGAGKFKAWERTNIFYWYASWKIWISERYSYLFRPESGGNMMGSGDIGRQRQESIDNQIRALTGGDVTKEGQIRQIPVHRALTELNAQAREYEQIKKR